MKVKVIPTIIACGISSLLAYAFYNICHTEGKELLLAIGGGLCIFVTLATSLGLRFEQPRTSANVAFVGVVFFLLMLVSNAIFAYSHFVTHSYVIVNGLLLLSFLLISYYVTKAKQ
jgi:hypothetical protein